MNKKQRQTLERVFEKLVRSDISWSDIENLFRANPSTIRSVRRFLSEAGVRR